MIVGDITPFVVHDSTTHKRIVVVYIDSLVMISIEKSETNKKEHWKSETNLSRTMISIEKSETKKEHWKFVSDHELCLRLGQC